MPTMSDRALTMTYFLRQGSGDTACDCAIARVRLLSLALLSGGAVCVQPRADTGIRHLALRCLYGLQVPRLAKQQSVEHRSLKRPNPHRCQVQRDKSNVARYQHPSSVASHAHGRKEIRYQ